MIDKEQWEYKVIRIKDSDEEKEKTFNLLGLEGWELVFVISSERSVHSTFYFKRKVNLINNLVQ